MKFFINSLFLLLTTFGSISVNALTLKKGDILLQELNCRTCSLIEAQTKSPYSHIAIVVSENPLLIAEAFLNVRLQTLEELQSKSEKVNRKTKPLKVMRHIQHHRIGRIYDVYMDFFHSKKYDSLFTWDDETIYCSELTWKLLDFFSLSLPELKIMRFDQSPLEWDKFFRGQTPRGQWGISPANFERSHFFKHIGYIYDNSSE